jgi:hypothetical protein
VLRHGCTQRRGGAHPRRTRASVRQRRRGRGPPCLRATAVASRRAARTPILAHEDEERLWALHQGCMPRWLPLDGLEQRVAGLVAAPALLGAHAAVLHAALGMSLALVTAAPAAGDASGELRPGDVGIALGPSAHYPARGRADVGAVEVETNALDERLDPLLGEAAVSARGARLGAIRAGVDAARQQRLVDAQVTWIGVEHPLSDGHPIPFQAASRWASLLRATGRVNTAWITVGQGRGLLARTPRALPGQSSPSAPERSRTSTSLYRSQGPQPCCWRSSEVLLGSVKPFQIGSVRSLSLKLGPRTGPRVPCSSSPKRGCRESDHRRRMPTTGGSRCHSYYACGDALRFRGDVGCRSTAGPPHHSGAE